MKILVCCDHGNNRSVHFAHRLKYWNNDVLAAGLDKNSQTTLRMLCEWADLIIITEESQKYKVHAEFDPKIKLFDVGPDTYPRPFNDELLAKVKEFLEDNKELLKNA